MRFTTANTPNNSQIASSIMGNAIASISHSGLACASAACLFSAAVLLFVADKIRQPSRGTRLPLGQIQQNIQHENKSTFLKSTQRPLSVPNLKFLFNGNAKLVNDENQDIEKTAQSHYLPTAFVPPVRKSLAKRNTTIFRDPILTTVEEVDDASVAPKTNIANTRAKLHENTNLQLDVSTKSSASFCVPESIIESTKEITLAQQDTQKKNIITTIAAQSQTSSLRNISSNYTSLPALPKDSDLDSQAIADAVHTAEQYLNPPTFPKSIAVDIHDSRIITAINAELKPSALTDISEPATHQISVSPELSKSLIVKKVRGPTKCQSNNDISNPVEVRQVTTYLKDAPVLSTITTDSNVEKTTTQPDNQESLTEFSGSNIHMDSKEQGIPAAFASLPALETLPNPTVKDEIQPSTADSGLTNLASERKSSLEEGLPLRDPNDPKGLRKMAVNSIRPDSHRSKELLEAPKPTQRVTVKKTRDATIQAADYPAPMPWAPALQPPEIHQHVDNVAIPGMVGPKAVQSRYLTPHYTVSADPRGVDAYRDEEGYDSYEEDDYVTARSYNAESTNDGVTTDLYPRWTQKTRRELSEAAKIVEATRSHEDMEDEAMDPTMVAEYGDEIFEHLRYLEMKLLPNPFYMEQQTELQWSMRAVLMDWLVQVHSRCNLLPETLFITGNFVDRFLSGKIVSLGKLQLVGATALFLAAKKEEINCPTLSEIVYMVDNTYSSEELIKAERYMVNILQWELEWPGPMSFLRRISKADDYDLDTRTVAKYFLEVTLMEERFIGTPPSFAAAASHCLARLVLRKGPWTPHHVHYSGYTYAQIYPLLELLLYCVESPIRHHAAVYEKYTDKRFKRASTYVEVAIQQGFVLPSPQGSSNRYIMNDLGVPYAPLTPFQDLSYGGTTNTSATGMVFAH